MMKRPRGLSIFLSFIAGILFGVVGPRLLHGGLNKMLFPEQRREIARATSPDGTVDAVAEGIECGAPCSSGYSVYVVPKGGAPPKDAVQQVFVADDVINTKIRWNESHLLDISYDKAFIHTFRNVTYPLGRPGNVESWRYAVEIHLSPSSARFSYLPDGNRGKDSE